MKHLFRFKKKLNWDYLFLECWKYHSNFTRRSPKSFSEAWNEFAIIQNRNCSHHYNNFVVVKVAWKHVIHYTKIKKKEKHFLISDLTLLNELRLLYLDFAQDFTQDSKLTQICINVNCAKLY